MVYSKDKTNQRFIDMLRMQHAQRYGVKIGIKGFNSSEHRPTNMAEPSVASVEKHLLSFSDQNKEELNISESQIN